MPYKGLGILCFPNSKWWQGHLMFITEATGERVVWGLLGEAVSPPGDRHFHECCYPEGLPLFYDVNVFVDAATKDQLQSSDDAQPNDATDGIRIVEVERSHGDLPRLTSSRFHFRSHQLLLDKDAASMIQQYFPNITATAKCMVAIGDLELSLDDDLESVDDSESCSHA